MLRSLLCAMVALLVFAGSALADEAKGKVKKIDADKKTVVVTVGDDDKEFTTDADTKILNAKDKPLKDGLKSLKEGAEVTVTHEKKGDKMMASKIQLKGK